MSRFRNQITDLYNAVSAPVAVTRDALSKRLQSVRDTVTLLYERAKQKLGYGQPLKDIVEEQANQDYIGTEDIKHVYPRAKTQTTDNGIQGMRYLFDEHDMQLRRGKKKSSLIFMVRVFLMRSVAKPQLF